MKLFSVITAACLTVAFSTCVWAEDGKDAAKGPGKGGGAARKGRGADGAGFQELIKRFDKDGDGKLSDAEKAAAREGMGKGGRPGAAGGPPGRKPGGAGGPAAGGRGGELLKRFDKDGDGQLSEQEKAAAREAFQGRRPEGKKKPE